MTYVQYNAVDGRILQVLHGVSIDTTALDEPFLTIETPPEGNLFNYRIVDGELVPSPPEGD